MIKKVFLLAALLSVATFSGGCKKRTDGGIPTAGVTKGVFYLDLYEEGEVEAVNSISVSTPVISYRFGSQLKIAQMVKDGDEVEAGDTLTMFDPAEVNKGIDDAQNALEISLAELEQMKATQQFDLEGMQADYEVTRLSQEISKIRFESAVYESGIKKKEIQLNLDKADIALETSREQINNQIKINDENIKQKELQINQNRRTLDEGYESLKKMVLTAPSPGIAIIETNWSTQSKYQVGDQLWSNYPLIQLPDLSSLKATININEVDISKITRGQRVEIRPDAFSDSVFTGTVNKVANLAIPKQGATKIKVFPVEIYIDGTNENMLPGLTVSCRIIVDEIADVLSVPVYAVHTEGASTFVYKKSAGGYVRTEVVTGLANSDRIIITSGLDEGDEVALTDPFATDKDEEATEDNAQQETQQI